MTVDADPPIGVENERRKRIDELTAEQGADWEVRYQPGSFGCHELLDRACLLADQLEDTILAHPSCIRDPQWYALAARAVEDLRELYQRVGSEHL